MTGLEPILLGSAAAGATATTAATAATAGLFGVGGSFSALTALGTVSSLGSALFGMQAQIQQSAGEVSSTRFNAATEAIQSAQSESKLRREQYLRQGSQMAAAAGQGRGVSGNVLDIIADTAYQNELDILGLRQSNEMSQRLSQSKISATKQSSRLQTGSSILTGVSKLTTGGVV